MSKSVCWVGTNRDWDLSLRMTERYLWAHSVMHHHNELNLTKELATGSCVTERVKILAGNEIEQGMGIPTIESRASIIPVAPKLVPMAEIALPIYKSLPPDHSGTPRDVRDLIRDSEQHSGYCIYISLQP